MKSNVKILSSAFEDHYDMQSFMMYQKDWSKVPATIKLLCSQGLSSSPREQGFWYNNRRTRANKEFHFLLLALSQCPHKNNLLEH